MAEAVHVTLRRSDIPKGKDGPTQVTSWHWAIAEVVAGGFQFTYVVVRCPVCQRLQTVGVFHSIDEDGVVSPEYRCPFKCPWEAALTLHAWEFGAKPRGRTELASVVV